MLAVLVAASVVVSVQCHEVSLAWSDSLAGPDFCLARLIAPRHCPHTPYVPAAADRMLSHK